MFTVVLIMQRDVDTNEPCAKCFVRLDAIFVARIYITPPFKIGAREVVAALPALSLNQRQDASAITAWLGAKNPLERAAFQGFGRQRRLRNPLYFASGAAGRYLE